ISVVSERQAARKAGELDSGQFFQMLERLPVKVDHLFFFAESCLGQIDTKCEGVFGLEAGINMYQSRKAAQHQPCANKQDQRKRNLRNDQHAPQSLVPDSATASTRCILEGFIEIGLAGVQRRNKAENETGSYSDQRGESDDLPVEANAARARDAIRKGGNNHGYARLA